MSYLTRTLADGSIRHCVRYKDADGRHRRRFFDDEAEAAEFRAVLASARPRWPVQPFLDAVKLSRSEVGKVYGIKLYGRDTITSLAAENYADAVGLFPVEVWGWAWVEAGEALAALDGDEAAA